MPAYLPTEAMIECDECGVQTTVDLTEFAGNPPSVGVSGACLSDGWETDEADTFWCPDCSEKREEED